MNIVNGIQDQIAFSVKCGAQNGNANANQRQRQIDRAKVDEEHHVRKFGDAVNSGQAMRCRDINVVWSSLLKQPGEIYFGTVTRCSRICRMYVYTARQSTVLR